MSSLAPRVVLVTRQTEYDRLLATHATRGQTEFFLTSREQSLDVLEGWHNQQLAALDQVKRAVPDEWSVAQVLRSDLDRFLFGRDDIVVAIGQDGLVANLAKYLDGQPVVGVTPDPENSEGVLTRMSAGNMPQLLPRVAALDIDLQKRVMVEAKLDNGENLSALNELFIGHRSHQSARYLLGFAGQEEFQSSSGVIVSTGTGLTGWARSILNSTRREVTFTPEERRAAFFAREPWPSRMSGAELSFGEIRRGQKITVTSRMNEGGVIFADGIEQDFLRFDWGIKSEIAVSRKTLNLVRG